MGLPFLSNGRTTGHTGSLKTYVKLIYYSITYWKITLTFPEFDNLYIFAMESVFVDQGSLKDKELNSKNISIIFTAMSSS